MREWYGTKFFKYAQESHVQTQHCLEIVFYIWFTYTCIYANCLLHLWLYDGVVKYEIKNKKMKKIVKSFYIYLFTPTFICI